MGKDYQNNKKHLPDDFSDVVDEEDYSWGDQGGFSISTLIHKHLDRISQFIFKGGSSNPEYSDSGKYVQKKSDGREIVIDAIQILEALLKPYFDKYINESTLQLYEKIGVEEVKFQKSSLEREAYTRASRGNPDMFNKHYLYWINELKKNDSVMYDKDSIEYEYFLSIKYYLYIKLFEQMNLLLFRNDYLATKPHEE